MGRGSRNQSQATTEAPLRRSRFISERKIVKKGPELKQALREVSWRDPSKVSKKLPSSGGADHHYQAFLRLTLADGSELYTDPPRLPKGKAYIDGFVDNLINDHSAVDAAAVLLEYRRRGGQWSRPHLASEENGENREYSHSLPNDLVASRLDDYRETAETLNQSSTPLGKTVYTSANDDGDLVIGLSAHEIDDSISVNTEFKLNDVKTFDPDDPTQVQEATEYYASLQAQVDAEGETFDGSEEERLARVEKTQKLAAQLRTSAADFLEN